MSNIYIINKNGEKQSLGQADNVNIEYPKEPEKIYREICLKPIVGSVKIKMPKRIE